MTKLTILENIPDGLFVVSGESLVYVNQRFADLFGYPIAEILGRPYIDFVAPSNRQLISNRHQARLAGEKASTRYELKVTTRSGESICCELSIRLVEDPKQGSLTIGTIRDISQRERERDALESSKLELQSIFDQLPDVFYRTDMNGVITLISPICFDAIGYRPEEMIGTPMADYYFTPEDRQNVVQAIKDGHGAATQVEAAMRHKNGQKIWVSTNARIRLDENSQPCCVEGIARNITSRKEMEDRLLTLSRIDSLTGTFNRQYFMEYAENVLQMMQRYKRDAALMVADLDHFKRINDQHGHHAGDLALQAFSQICRENAREADVIGRMGGEEFFILMPETSLENAQALAERIRLATATLVIPVDGKSIQLTVSIGIVAYTPEDTTLDLLIQRADKAMYLAKDAGRNLTYTY